MSRTPHADEPFLTTLTMDLTNVQAPGQGMLEYSVTLLAKKLGDRQRITLGEARGLIQSAQNAEIGVECAGLGRGIYRLEVATTLRRPEGSAEPADGLSALLEGGLLQIL